MKSAVFSVRIQLPLLLVSTAFLLSRFQVFLLHLWSQCTELIKDLTSKQARQVHLRRKLHPTVLRSNISANVGQMMCCITDISFDNAVNNTLRVICLYVTPYEFGSCQGLVCLFSGFLYTAKLSSGVGIKQQYTETCNNASMMSWCVQRSMVLILYSELKCVYEWRLVNGNVFFSPSTWTCFCSVYSIEIYLTQSLLMTLNQEEMNQTLGGWK